MGSTLLVRTDSSPTIGVGHAIRCLALAEAWRAAGGAVVFAMSESMLAIDSAVCEVASLERQDAEPGSRDDASATVRLASILNASAIVVDGYRFDSEYLRAVRGTGRTTLAIDDTGALPEYPVDFVLNGNIAVGEGLYRGKAPGAQLLLGPTYAPMRERFRRRGPTARETPEVATRLLLTMGGGASDEAIATVLDAVDDVVLPGLSVVVAAGFSPTGRATIEGLLQRVPFESRVTSPGEDMAELMDWAHMAVSAGGSTSLELAFMGVPSITVVSSADQQANARGLSQSGAALDAGPLDELDRHALSSSIGDLAASASRRREMSRCAQRLVDGRGAERVVSAMKGLSPDRA